MPRLSIVIPVYNEDGNIKPLITGIENVFRNSFIDYEILLVDDGSTDKTAEVFNECTGKNIVFISLRKNYGQTAALKAGIDNSEGEYIATMDGDLQNDPEDLPKMMSLLENGNCDVVTGIRVNRKDDMLFRKVPSIVANYILRKVTGTDIKDNGCGIKIFRSDILKDLPLYGERHRILVSLAYLDGADIRQIDVKHHPRIMGKSKYGLGRTFKIVSDLILLHFYKKYGQKPMYLFGPAGMLTSIAGAAILLNLLYDKIIGSNIWGRPILILGILLILMGFQIISTGLILEMIVKRNYETNGGNPYKIKRIIRPE
jgi:glycosyltransferase involved in cell wall biosynthesis